MSSKSGISNQVISLPQGGGALRGVGETFSPDLHTGTGNFTVPLALPPGRGGLSPQLSLVYSTGSGNGPFGLGWSLSVPGVSRKTSKGVPIYDDARDTFVLSGAEDLVPVPGGGVGMQRYRPRVEGLFARITRHRDAQNDWWEVRSRDGLVSLYGTPGATGDDPAALADPTGRSRVFAWKLTRTTDSFGNRIDYRYERDARWVDGPHLWDQLYLSEVRYADHGDPGDPQFLVTVRFIYADRPDPFSDYRAGFEVRTIRRCTRIEVSTHAGTDALTRTYTLVYLDQRGVPSERLPPNAVSLLSEVRVAGHDGTRSEPLPPLEFAYTAFEPARRRYQPLSARGNALPERSLGHPEYELVDLFGNGLPDIVQLNHAGVRYWRNRGGGAFDVPRAMASAPAGVTLADAGVQMADLNGDGRTDLLVTDGTRAGYYPLTFRGGWDARGFVPYPQAPALNLEDSNVRLMDLDGDGVVDALRTGVTFELYYNDPDKGGWVGIDIRQRGPLEDFPDVNFGDPRVKLADMTGDGLLDIVLIHNGRIDYWPYLGYGRWGRRITMRRSPRFEDAAVRGAIGYDPRRVLVADIDGDGCADLVYVGSGHITVWINQSGNAWSEPVTVRGTPPITDADAVRVADMLGTGTAGILWSYDHGTYRDSAYKFLDLTGGVKPHLLHRMDNHTGAVTEVEYAPSTRFYLEDEARPETRWRTPLPLPVQVVARVTVADALSRGRLTTEYRYHHGYWDGVEREFRGFGMVEQLDAEAFETPADDHRRSPPTLTKTWFHQGATEDGAGGWGESDFGAEFWPGDRQLLARAPAVTDLLGSLSPRARRDALRALRGSILRTELYTLDGDREREDRPYTVTESSYGLREEAPPGPGEADRPRVFFPHALAQRTTQWERGDDPLTRFTFTDAYDAFGQPRRQTEVGLPRRAAKRRVVVGAVVGAVDVDESAVLATHAATDYAVPDAGLYLHDRVAQVRTFELNDPPGATEGADEAAIARVVHERFGALLAPWRAGQPLPAGLRLIGHSLNHYDGAAFAGRPAGEVGPFGAPTRSEALAFTGAELDAAYGDRRPSYLGGGAAPPSGAPAEFGRDLGYRPQVSSAEGYHEGYYADTQRQKFDFQVVDPQAELGLPAGTPVPRRGLAVAVEDPLGNRTMIVPDAFWFLPRRVVDAVGLATEAEYDHRILQPRRVTDANGHATHFRYTPLGLLHKQFVRGRDGEGGSEDAPEVEFAYDFFAYARTRGTANPQPIAVHTRQRVWHASDNISDEAIESREYSDGFGRLIQKRAQAEELTFGDGGDDVGLPRPAGSAPVPAQARRAADRVVVSGWQVYDNKGRVIEKYEPFFATGWAYQPGAEAMRGEHARLYYDPRGQLVRTVNPDGSAQRVIFGVPSDLANPNDFAPTPWESCTYDANDLAPLSRDPATEQPLTDRAPGAHHLTPTSAVVDALGRVICQVERNGPTPAEHWFVTRSAYDVRGNLLTVWDAHGRVAFRHAYDLLNRPLRVESIDAGVRTSVPDAAANLVEYRDSKGSVALRRYDRLNRLTHIWARNDPGAALTQRERLEYGDGGDPNQAESERQAQRAANRLGRLWRHRDEAGLVEVGRYDFKGNPAEKTRRVVGDAALAAGWVADWGAAGSDGALDATPYRTDARFDALNRPIEVLHPQDAEGRRAVLRPRYNRAGALEAVELDGQPHVARIAYNAKGQRVLVAYGNGVMTRHAYDPRTFRLARLRSERYQKPAADTWRGEGPPLQDFTYDYDLVGNITLIEDRTPNGGITNSPDGRDRLRRRFEYDPLYRLIRADGRACTNIGAPRPFEDVARCGFHPAGDPTVPSQDNAPELTERYTEAYRYDPAHNLLELRYLAGSPWTRTLAIEEGSNRLVSVTQGGNTHGFAYDASGNLLRQGTDRHHAWDHADRLIAFMVQPPGAKRPSVEARYLYGADGMRVKKWVRTGGRGDGESTVCIDGAFEHHRWTENRTAKQNNHLHVMDGQQRIALVRRGPARADDAGPAGQYHLGDHLGSSAAVIDAAGAWINREEYFPYGETSFGSFARKRYRYTGKERDPESGLYYHGARYYAPWLGRWAAADPIGLGDGTNLYWYARCNPIALADSTGFQSQTTEQLDNPTIVRRGEYSGQETQEQVQAEYAEVGVYYTGEAQWDPEHSTWWVDRSQLAEPEVVTFEDDIITSQNDGIIRPTGQSAVTTWDALQRSRYVSENVRASQAAQRVIEAAHQEGNAVRAWEAAEEASNARNVRRAATQRSLSPGGRALSQALEAERSFSSMVRTYSSRLPGIEGGSTANTRYSYEIARRVAVGAGESRASIKTLARFGRVAGPIGLAVGVALGAHAIATAPEAEKGRVAAREVGSFVGGALGASVGMGAGVALAGGISGFLVGLGVASGPIGWLAIGLGLLGAVAVGMWFSYRGGQIGGAVHGAIY